MEEKRGKMEEGNRKVKRLSEQKKNDQGKLESQYPRYPKFFQVLYCSQISQWGKKMIFSKKKVSLPQNCNER